MSKGLIFSGVQPTGNLHLGNYLGAIKNWVKLQREYDCIFCIVDLHAITVPQDPAKLRAHTLETTAAYVACGIDPETAIIFNQSTVPGHNELAWILGCHTTLGQLNRMTQSKEKSEKESVEGKIKFQDGTSKKEESEILSKIRKVVIDEQNIFPSKASLGLFAYPVLMAADILLYKATHVPVGEDQKQHLELARDIAGAFNRWVDSSWSMVDGKKETSHQPSTINHQPPGFFPLPEPLIQKEAARVMSLRDGTKKMSKSDESDYSRINLTDDADAIVKKFKKATSDSTVGFHSLENRPEALNLLAIHAALTDSTPEATRRKFIDSGFAGLKKELAEVAVAALAPISRKMNELQRDPGYLESVLRDGAEKAAAIAEKNMKEIKKLVGFYQP